MVTVSIGNLDFNTEMLDWVYIEVPETDDVYYRVMVTCWPRGYLKAKGYEVDTVPCYGFYTIDSVVRLSETGMEWVNPVHFAIDGMKKIKVNTPHHYQEYYVYARSNFSE